MSKRKIEAALKKKNIKARSIEFVRGVPTPSGYASGYDIEFEPELEDVVFGLDNSCNLDEFMEFDNFEQVMDWIASLPVLPNNS